MIKIKIDSREKTALVFSPDITTEIIKLNCGDYNCEFEDGTTSLTFFERKSHSDLWGSLTRDYPRFRDEVMLSKALGITLILIVESSLNKVMRGFTRSEVMGISIIKTMFSLWTRYGIFPVFCKDREEVAEYITQYYLAEQRKRNEKKS